MNVTKKLIIFAFDFGKSFSEAGKVSKSRRNIYLPMKFHNNLHTIKRVVLKFILRKQVHLNYQAYRTPLLITKPGGPIWTHYALFWKLFIRKCGTLGQKIPKSDHCVQPKMSNFNRTLAFYMRRYGNAYSLFTNFIDFYPGLTLAGQWSSKRYTMASFGKFCPKTGAWISALLVSFSFLF